MTTNFSKAKSLATSFNKSEDGAVAIIFGLVAIILVMMTGLAIDVGRVMHAERKLTGAVDSAALAGAKALKTPGATDAMVRTVAQTYFQKNMEGGGSYAVVTAVNVQVDRSNNSVTVDVDGSVPATFGQLAGIQKFDVPKSSVAIYDTKDIEIGLQLDVTGSMCSPCRKINDLKDAVAGPGGLLDIMLPNGGPSGKVRIGLAPFAGGVNAGVYAAAVTENRATNGCVYERRNTALQATEVAAAGPSSLKARVDLGSPQNCPPDAKVVAMSDDKAMLRATINSWSTSTSTAGHLGAAWAWYLLSPEWTAIWPASAKPANYNDGKTSKYVILMTDGAYNTIGGQMSGANVPLSNRFAVDTCNAMKAKGVTVYTIGFEVAASDRAPLIACASDSSKFFDATNGAALRASFRAIAEEINSLRLSR